MLKIIKKSILYMCLMLMFSIGFFMLLQTNVVSEKIEETSQASITGVSGEQIYLTARQGFQPTHYFTDDNGESTLVNMSNKFLETQYMNEKGSLVSNFYTLVSESSMKKGYSSGLAKFVLSEEMKTFAEDGILFVQACAGVHSLDNDANDAIQISVSSGRMGATLTSNYAKNIEWLKTEFIKVDPESAVEFSFSSLGTGNLTNKCQFVIYEPKFIFKVALSSEQGDVESDDEGPLSLADIENLHPGDVAKIEARSKVLNKQGNTDYCKYYRSLFKPKFEITRGREYASIEDGYLFIKNNINENVEIEITARCIKDSILGEKFGEIISRKVFTIYGEKVEVKVESDFTNPAKYFGQGKYHVGKFIEIEAVAQPGFIFKNWEVNGEIINSKSLDYIVQPKNEIKCHFVRILKIESIFAEKVYDGNCETDVNVKFDFDPKEENHDVYIDGLVASFQDANVGQEKVLSLEGFPVLKGENKDLYELDIQNSASEGKGNIIQKNITVCANESYKTYGDVDGVIDFTVSEEVTLIGKLDREKGEKVGQYEINLGTLAESNPNYNIKLKTNKFTILKRVLEVNIVVESKIYDKTTKAEFEYSLENVIEKDKYLIDVNLEIEFESPSAGSHLMNIVKAEITGEAKDCYVLKEIENIYGNISAKLITVTADNVKKVYSDEEKELTYTAEGLFEGDSLSGALDRDVGEDVGTYSINRGSLSNSNYSISFISGDYEIVKREVSVVIDATSKTYGQSDPVFTYALINAKNEDEVRNLVVLARASGEDVGSYEISLGNVRSNNYSFKFEKNYLTISKKQVNVVINATNKIYDGTTKVSPACEIQGLAFKDSVEVVASMKFKDANVGENKEVIDVDYYFAGVKVQNYDYSVSLGLRADIFRKDVKIYADNKSKIYGEDDPQFTYIAEGVVAGDLLKGSLTRQTGRNAGEYAILLGSLNNENNANYNIILDKNPKLEILPTELTVRGINKEKVFGNSDPEFEFVADDEKQLKYGDDFYDVVSGAIAREQGEIPGKYNFLKGTLTTNSNYVLSSNISGNLKITKKSVKVFAENAEKIYGNEDPEFTYQTEGTVDGYDIHMTLRREYGENVGKYTITYSSLIDPRYEIEFTPAKLTVTPKNVSVIADKKYKEYGTQDPIFSVSVIGDDLAFNDVVSEIQQGLMTRKEGEFVGLYEILQGTYNLGANYRIVKFVSNTLEILRAEVTVKADLVSKHYGDVDQVFTYQIVEGTLKEGDSFAGQLSRVPGEIVGEYEISQGNLSLNSNYILKFISSKLVIEKREITIKANPAYKVYGEVDPILTYSTEGELCFGDTIDVELSRFKPSNDHLYEMAGKYEISASFESSNHEIIYIPNYLIIEQREIVVKATNVSKTYGETDPVLSYEVVSGDILEGDVISGNIYRVEGNNAGKYDIRSNLTLGRNYKIIFIKGVFEIKPIDIYITTHDYTKTYGESSPEFKYEITKGSLLDGDILLGGVSKENGEDVGKYRLISAFNNTNYNVILTENYLTITPKKAYLNITIQDKVFDGKDVAYIKQAVVVGLIDDVKLAYEKEDCARFVSVNPGVGIAVEIKNIALDGEKAGNYQLVYPTNVKGNITYDCLSSENEEVSIKTSTNTDLSFGTTLFYVDSIENIDVDTKNKEVVGSFKAWLENGENKVELKSSIKVYISLPVDYQGRKNYYVYGTDKNGARVLLNSTLVDGKLEVTSDTLGEFIILSDNESWIDIAFYVSVGLLGVVIIWIIVHVFRKSIAKRKKAKKEK